MSRVISGVISGAVGACTLTAVHESVRHRVPDAPRLDLLGMRGLDRALGWLHLDRSSVMDIRRAALVGDLVSNTIYFSLVGAGAKHGAFLRGAALGVAAGMGALVLPGPMGLGEAPTNRTRKTQLLTVSLYTGAGLLSAAVYRMFRA